MAWTESDLLKLEEAISEGVLEVRLDDRTIRYQSANQMIQSYNFIVATIEEDKLSALGRLRPRAYRARPSKGVFK